MSVPQPEASPATWRAWAPNAAVGFHHTLERAPSGSAEKEPWRARAFGSAYLDFGLPCVCVYANTRGEFTVPVWMPAEIKSEFGKHKRVEGPVTAAGLKDGFVELPGFKTLDRNNGLF